MLCWPECRTLCLRPMKIKQTWYLALLLSVSILPFFSNDTAYAAISRDRFATIVCRNFTQPAANAPCVNDAKDGELSKRYHGKVYKYSDWKDKSVEALQNDIDRNSNSNDRNQDSNDGSQSWADGDGCGGADTAIIKCDADNSGEVQNNGIWAILLIVINIMTAGVGVLAVAGIVYGSILYTTAGDKADQVKKAIDVITNVVIGLIAFALMWAGLNFLIPGGVFA